VSVGGGITQHKAEIANSSMTFVSRGLKLHETEIRVCEYQNIVHSHSNL